MTADATVVAVTAISRVEVEFDPPRGCSGCERACLWRRMPVAQRLTFDTSLTLAVGDPVVVALPDRYLLLGSILVHGLPLAAMLGGAVAGAVLGGSDGAAVLGAALAIGAGLLAAPWLRSRLERDTLRRVELRPGSRRHAHAHSL
jgi:positive regulator of sigma E activity